MKIIRYYFHRSILLADIHLAPLLFYEMSFNLVHWKKIIKTKIFIHSNFYCIFSSFGTMDIYCF